MSIFVTRKGMLILWEIKKWCRDIGANTLLFIDSVEGAAAENLSVFICAHLKSILSLSHSHNVKSKSKFVDEVIWIKDLFHLVWQSLYIEPTCTWQEWEIIIGGKTCLYPALLFMDRWMLWKRPYTSSFKVTDDDCGRPDCLFRPAWAADVWVTSQLFVASHNLDMWRYVHVKGE